MSFRHLVDQRLSSMSAAVMSSLRFTPWRSFKASKGLHISSSWRLKSCKQWQSRDKTPFIPSRVSKLAYLHWYLRQSNEIHRFATPPGLGRWSVRFNFKGAAQLFRNDTFIASDTSIREVPIFASTYRCPLVKKAWSFSKDVYHSNEHIWDSIWNGHDRWNTGDISAPYLYFRVVQPLQHKAEKIRLNEIMVYQTWNLKDKNDRRQE